MAATLDLTPIPHTISVEMLRHIHRVVRDDFYAHNLDYPPRKKDMIETYIDYVSALLEKYEAEKPVQQKLV